MVDRSVLTFAIIVISFCAASGAPCGNCCVCCSCEPCSCESTVDDTAPTDEQETRSFLSDWFQSAGRTVSDWVTGLVEPYLDVFDDISQKVLSGPDDFFTLDENEQMAIPIADLNEDSIKEMIQKWSQTLETMDWHEFMVLPGGGIVATAGSNETHFQTQDGSGTTFVENEWQTGQTNDGNTFKQSFSVSSTFN